MNITQIRNGIAAGVVSLVSTAWSVADDPARAMTVNDVMRAGSPYANIANPDALQIEDVLRWARMLRADESQTAMMQRHYRDFVEKHNAFMKTAATSYLNASTELAKLEQKVGMSSPEYVKASAAFVEKSFDVQNQLEQIEHEYIDAILAGLDEHQRDEVYVMRQEASRRQARCSIILTRWANVELRFVWESILPEVNREDDREAMEGVLADYEMRVTPLLVQAVRQERTGGVKMLELLALDEASSIAGEELEARYQAVWDAIGRAYRQVREATEQAVAAADAVLSPAIAARFVAEAKASAFPELYPDKTFNGGLFKNVFEQVDIDAPMRTGVRDTYFSYLHEYNEICRQAEAVCIEWGDQMSRGQISYAPQFLPGELEPFMAKRRAVSERWLQALREIVGEHVVTENMPKPVNRARTPAQLRATSAGRMRPASELRSTTRSSE